MSTGTLIGTIHKSRLEEVRVRLDAFKSLHLFDIRVFADFTGSDPEKRPTKKGCTLRIEALPELIALLQQAEAKAIRLGLNEARPGEVLPE